MTKHFGLIILDGWGIGDRSKSDAVFQAHTPFMDALLEKYPHAKLGTSGEDVGLPEGQMGNSEVGHMNIGAGRIVYQELTRINKSIRDGDFFKNPNLLKAIRTANENQVALHLMGLVSRGGVHSSQDHLVAICQLAKQEGLDQVFIHAFTDGRDCDPTSGLHFLEELEAALAESTGKIASITGRYYAMDRDNRWERVKVAYDALVHAKGTPFLSAQEAVRASYAAGKTDEFIEPCILMEGDQPLGTIKEQDVVVSFNFRTDRPREISIALTQKDFPEHHMKKLNLHYYTMTNYDATFQGVSVLFEKDNLTYTLGEVLAKVDRTQVRIAETEKYPHVTFFFNGGREIPFSGERRIMVNSPKVATYDLQPEMSAVEVKDKIIESIQKDTPHFFCLNFANPDMVGHTGVYDAIVKAVETVDHSLQQVIEAGLQKEYEFLVIADHGNADFAINPDGTPNTAHSLNPVPVVLVSKQQGLQLRDGILADVAPTILRRLGISTPMEMTGTSLL
jgi:2,3-bisphosphoglycerate-independent phosphoglycerate mutase